MLYIPINFDPHNNYLNAALVDDVNLNELRCNVRKNSRTDAFKVFSVIFIKCECDTFELNAIYAFPIRPQHSNARRRTRITMLEPFFCIFRAVSNSSQYKFIQSLSTTPFTDFLSSHCIHNVVLH